MGARRKRFRKTVHGPERRMHRIATVRQQRGLSLEEIARLLDVEVDELRQQEDEHSDLWLSHLYKWQKALNVPVEDLLVEGTPSMAEPEVERAQLAKLIETATSVLQSAGDRRVKSIARMFISQIIELMPDLKQQSAELWENAADLPEPPTGSLLPPPKDE